MEHFWKCSTQMQLCSSKLPSIAFWHPQDVCLNEFMMSNNKISIAMLLKLKIMTSFNWDGTMHRDWFSLKTDKANIRLCSPSECIRLIVSKIDQQEPSIISHYKEEKSKSKCSKDSINTLENNSSTIMCQARTLKQAHLWHGQHICMSKMAREKLTFSAFSGAMKGKT